MLTLDSNADQVNLTFKPQGSIDQDNTRPNQPVKPTMLRRENSREIRKRGLDKLKDEYRKNL